MEQSLSHIFHKLLSIECLEVLFVSPDFRLTLLADGVFGIDRDWAAGATHGESEKNLHRQNGQNGHKHKGNGVASGGSYGPLDDDYSDLDVYEGNGRAFFPTCSVSRCVHVASLSVVALHLVHARLCKQSGALMTDRHSYVINRRHYSVDDERAGARDARE